MDTAKAINSIRSHPSAAAAAILVALSIFSHGCGGGEKSQSYEAERALFQARKYASELTFPTINKEFLDRTLESYRIIITEYGSGAGSTEGLDLIIVTAQMELAELEFRAAMFEDARKDFLHAYEIAGNVPGARANALWSAAVISRESGDPREARRLFEKFHAEFLSEGQILDTARLNSTYLLTPIRIAEICGESADSACSAGWLDEAEKLYILVIRSDAQEELRKEARYNLVSAYLLSGEWSKARSALREMRRIYRAEADIPSLLYLEARVELDGFENRDGAIALFDSIASLHPESKEASSALLMKGNILLEEMRYDDAAVAYETVLEKYGSSGPEAVEAEWQLAILEQRRGNWIAASLHYKSVYTNYPATIQGLEAPLRIAAHYRETGEPDALEAAYERAAEHYEKLSSMQYSETIRIIAEEYRVRTLTEQHRWEEAASMLLALPDKYPQYHRFKGNCLMAASIYEYELDDPGRAAEILRNCAASYPGTALAEEASRQLERIGDSR
jgi:TolA-binding protein